MVLGPRNTVPVAALLACALAAPAARAQTGDDRLVAQIDQVAQVAQDPGGDLPPLTEDPPVPLDTPEPTPEPTATAEPTATTTPGASARGKRRRLPDTGADAGLLALAGFSLLGMGASLRWAAPGDAPD